MNKGFSIFSLIEAVSLWFFSRSFVKLSLWKMWLLISILPFTRGSNHDTLFRSFKIKCKVSGSCNIFSKSSLIETLQTSNAESMFNNYANESLNFITYQGITKFMKDLRIPLNKSSDSDAYDSSYDSALYDYDGEKTPCIESVESLLNEFYNGTSMYDVRISYPEFLLILPRFVFHLLFPGCLETDSQMYDYNNYDYEKETHDSHNHDGHNHADHRHHEEHDQEKSKTSFKTWGIALGSVAVISLLSLIGVMIVPLMRHSSSFKRLLAFLVALAVGTLIGDALLHLLPHAVSGHNHGDPEEEQNKILKSLAMVLSVQVFYNFESILSMVRARRSKKKATNKESPSKHVHSSMEKKPPHFDGKHSHSSFGGNGIVFNGVPNDSDKIPSFPLKFNVKETLDEETDTGIGTDSHDSRIFSSLRENGRVVYASIPTDNAKTPRFPLDLDIKKMVDAETDTDLLTESPDSSPINEGEAHGCDFHGHLHNDHHHHSDIAKAQGVKDLAWIVIAGDGLHNFSDGLAIGAAFTSSISAGLSTSLAVFCHELPHEFGDFAILLEAGLTIKKALVYNGLSACIAFIGVIIGLLIGEYTVTMKLWILAVTAGGFLYVALVDMLPQMLKQCLEKDGIIRLIFQNVGLVLGFSIMFLIAWFEESFYSIFNVPHGH